MEHDDALRYAEYLAQQTQEAGLNEPDNPLEQVKQVRQQQLLACDLEKRREMAQMLKQN